MSCRCGVPRISARFTGIWRASIARSSWSTVPRSWGRSVRTGSSTTICTTTPSIRPFAVTSRWRRMFSIGFKTGKRSAGQRRCRRRGIDPDDCARHFQLDKAKWAKVCERSAWFYEVTAYIRHDPTERLERATAYKEAARLIESGKAAEQAGITGLGIHPPQAP